MQTSKHPKKILGIDPGYADCGYGIITRNGGTLTYTECDNIVSPKHDALPKRLSALHDAITNIIKEHSPDLVAVEKIFFFKNQKTAIDVAQARGVILLAAAQHHIPIAEFTPPQIKQSLTSHGQATKSQVAQMVKTLLNLETLDKKDDAIDALAIAICASFRSRLS